MASATGRALYIGITTDLGRRLLEHRSGRVVHTAKYKIDRLIYVENFDTAPDAIAREKQLKGWRRSKKIALINCAIPIGATCQAKSTLTASIAKRGPSASLRSARDDGNCSFPAAMPPFAGMQQRPRNPYSSAEIDRASHERENEERMIELASSGAARFVPIDTEKNLVKTGGNPEAVFLQGMMARAVVNQADHHIFLGYVEGTPYFAVDVTGKDVPLKELGEFVDLRQVGALLFAREGSILAYARGMTYWHRRHRYCGVCGASTTVTRGGHVRRCTNESCKTEHFPRTDPAVIMLVHHGDKCLLGRSPHFPRGMHSTLAGFVEPGESFEDAVAREVYEEVRVHVKNVTYRSSQPWPFPASVMIGFHAEAESLDYDVNKSELEAARWMSRDDLKPENLPKDGSFFMPRRDSIARRLIEEWLGHEAGPSISG
ncbi:MAG: NAD(+) diphosphatase [Reyranella sp.]|nr:NAD(+) diphosphatase [Reyranella sp.]